MRYWMILLLFLSACGEFKSVTPTPAHLIEFSRVPEWQLTDLAGFTVQELTVIVFKEKIPAEQWHEIFNRTSELSRLRTEQTKVTLLIHDALVTDQPTDALEEQRDAITLKITDILDGISKNHAAHLIRWGEMEKCKFSAIPTLICKKLPKDSPSLSNLWQVKQPDPKKDLWVFPWVETELFTDNWRLTLKLKPEQRGANEWVWSGEVESDGKFSSPHDRYGYVEMRLSSRISR